MIAPHPNRKLPLAVWVLLGWSLFCCIWIIATRKPWQTLALDLLLPVKFTPPEDFISAGLWFGLLVSGVFALVLAATHQFWSGAEPAPMATADRKIPALSPGDRYWFFAVIAGLAGLIVWQCWPAMKLSFWGDEAAMFTEYVHGQWHARKTGDLKMQEALRFKEVPWSHAIFCDYLGSNHWLSTHLQRIVLKTWQSMTHQPAWRFEEWVVRLVPLSAGLAAMVSMANWLRSIGRPMAGLAAAAFLALHPSFIRFCVEVRGYSLMLLFFILTFWMIGRAWSRGRKRDWVAVGICQFLMLYSWKGSVYGLAFLNIVLALRFYTVSGVASSIRRRAAARWLAAGVMGAMVFVPLTTSSHLQLRKSIEITRKRAKPMDNVWRDTLVSETLFGVPWHERDPESPREVSIERRQRQAPWTLPAVALVGLILTAGLVRLWRQDRPLALMSAAVLLSGVAAAIHFKFGLRVELLTWYLVYQLPVLALLFGVAVTPSPISVVSTCQQPLFRRSNIGWATFAVLALAIFVAVAAPMVADFRHYPREDYQQAARLTRGVHEPPGFSGHSKIHTAWLWRYAQMYDPRGDTHVRTLEALEEKCRLAEEEGGEFYMVIGMRHLSEVVHPDLMQRLRDPAHFDHLTTLWGGEPINTLVVYRWRRARSGQTASTTPRGPAFD